MEYGVKQRFAGIAVLTALAVIVLPVVFDGKNVVSVQIPEPIPVRPAMPDIKTGAAVRAPPAREQAPVLVSHLYKLDTDQSALVDAGAEEKGVAASASSNSSGELDAYGIPQAWLVQVASLSDKHEADILVERLKQKGYRSFSIMGSAAQERVIRVFVGPKLDKIAANQIKQSLDKNMGLHTMVVPFASR